MAREAEWEELKRRSARRFGEDSVFGEGSLNSRLAIVGEAPGKQEVEEGRPFVGNAGKLLDKLLEEAGIDRSKVYVTNIVKVRPTKESEGRTMNRPPRVGDQGGDRGTQRGARARQTQGPDSARQHVGEGSYQEVVYPQVRARHPVRLGGRISGARNVPSRLSAEAQGRKQRRL